MPRKRPAKIGATSARHLATARLRGRRLYRLSQTDLSLLPRADLTQTVEETEAEMDARHWLMPGSYRAAVQQGWQDATDEARARG